MAVNLIKTGGSNSKRNQDFATYRQGKAPRTPSREMPAATNRRTK